MFNAGYRFSGDPGCGGFKLCLKMYHGFHTSDLKFKKQIDPHSYFGDDKFEIESVKNLNNPTGQEIKSRDILQLTLTCGLCKRGDIFGKQIILLQVS